MEDNYSKLTWINKATSHVLFVPIKVGVFPSTEAIFNSDNSPNILLCTLREVIKSKVDLEGLKYVEPRKFLWSRRIHLSLNEKDE